FDVLHDAGDDDALSIADSIDIDLDGVFQKSVDEHRLALGDHKRLGDKFFELSLIVTDFHGPAAEHETRPNEIGVANSRGLGTGFIHGPGDAVRRLAQSQSPQKLLEFFAVLRVFDRIDAGADDRYAGTGERAGQVERRLAAELHDHAIGLHAVADV